MVVFQRPAGGGNIEIEFKKATQFGKFGEGQGAIVMANASLTPSANVAAAGIMYVEDGALKYRGSNGTVTVIAPA